MATRDRLKSWRWGLILGTGMGVSAAMNAVAALIAQQAAFWEVIFVPPAMFGVGFLFGSMARRLRKLSDWFGPPGSFAIVTGVFTLFCVVGEACFANEPSGIAIASGLLFILSAILCAFRAFAGILLGFGWDWRHHSRFGQRGRGHELLESADVKRLCFQDEEQSR